MNYIQGVVFRRLGFAVIKSRYFKIGFIRGRTTQDQNVAAYCTLSLMKFHLLNSYTLKGQQSSELYCSIVEKKASEGEEVESAQCSLITKLGEINLTDDDFITTFRNLVRISKTHKSSKSENFEKELKEFVSSDGFRNFCDSVERRLPLLTASELKLLLDFELFHVPPSSALMQKIYFLMIEKINEYDVVGLLAIYVKIKNKSQEYPKCKALFIACELGLQSILSEGCVEKINFNAIPYFLLQKELPQDIQRKLFKLLKENFVQVHSQMKLHQLSQMFKAFIHHPFLKVYFRPEMFYVLKSRVYSDEVSFYSTVNMLQGFKNLLKGPLSYDEDFFNKLTEKNLTKYQNVSLLTILAKNLLFLGHFCFPLIKVLETNFRNPEFTLKSQKLCVNIATVLANVYYHPFGYCGDSSSHADSIKKLNSFDVELLDLKQYLSWCFCITVLGIERKFEYLNLLFQHLTQTYKDRTPDDELSASMAERIITLSAFARINFPNDVYQLPDEVLDKCLQVLKMNAFKFTNKFPSNSLANSYKVFENITSSMHHFINFCLLFDDDTKKTFITEDETSSMQSLRIEDIIKSKSKLLLYQLYFGNHPHQFRNSSNLPGQTQLYLKSFEPFDCKVILIDAKHLSFLSNQDQISYLMSKLIEGLNN